MPADRTVRTCGELGLETDNPAFAHQREVATGNVEL